VGLLGMTESAGQKVWGWLCLGGCVKLWDMKKQGSDQSFHDRRYQERKRAEAARKPEESGRGRTREEACWST
jgi:hypothetical protein